MRLKEFLSRIELHHRVELSTLPARLYDMLDDLCNQGLHLDVTKTHFGCKDLPVTPVWGAG